MKEVSLSDLKLAVDKSMEFFEVQVSTLTKFPDSHTEAVQRKYRNVRASMYSVLIESLSTNGIEVAELKNIILNADKADVACSNDEKLK